MAYLDLIRPKNLIIVAFTQLFFQYIIIVPVFKAAGLTLALSQVNLSLLILCTVLIAAGGNIINDYYDREIDKANQRRTKSLLLDTGEIFKFYLLIVILGGIIAFYVAWNIENLKLFLIYPIAAILLFLYSYKFKHLPLLGNLVVSLFTALVIFILLFAERNSIQSFLNNQSPARNILLYCSMGFMSFAFLSNLVREIVKDLEDQEGDRQNGSKTLPIVIGIKGAKIIATAFLILLLVALMAWPLINLQTNFHVANKIYLRLVLTLPIFYFLNKLYKAESKKHYHQLSQELKFYMIAGLLYLPFYYLS